MTSRVYFGSPRQSRLDAKESLPAKLDLIVEKLNIRERIKGETVAIKIHSGNNLGYSTVHPLFVRRLVHAVVEGGGKPFITDVDWDVRGAEARGYTPEVIGCPIYPSAGLQERYQYTHVEHPYKSIKEWHVAGMKENLPASFEVHTREGHPLRWLHGPLKDPYVAPTVREQLGLGLRAYELVDVLPVEKPLYSEAVYISAR